MPIREYVCSRCRNRFEKLYRSRAADDAAKNKPIPCPTCSYAAEQISSAPAPAHFKGSGFYQTDYKNK